MKSEEMPFHETISPTSWAHKHIGIVKYASDDTRSYWKKYKRTSKHKTLSSKRNGK